MPTTPPATTGTVAVPGGDLAYEVTSGTTGPVLAVHGISSHRRLWDWLHAAAPEVTLVAPDLRGRGDSLAVAGASSPERHADDLALLLDHLGLDRVPVVGMSMGGFVAVHLAARHPDRVAGLVLVDGGVPAPTPPGLTPDRVEEAFGDRTGRLSRTWDSLDEYLDHFCATTAPLLDRHDPVLRGYAEHDLRDRRARLSADALVSDATGVFFGDTPWSGVRCPVRFLHAEWSIGPDSAPMYPPDTVAAYAGGLARVVALDGLDHAGTIMTPRGATATAALVREMLAGEAS